MTFTHHVHVAEVTSTNDVARELLQDIDTVVVSADHQTSGRGRRGRTWEDEPGSSVLVSFGLRHRQERAAQDLAADMARGSLAVLELMRIYGLGERVRCKYPNDVQAVDAGVWSKLAGVLIEHDFMGSVCHTTIIGIGVNIKQKSFSETITQPVTSLHRLGIDRQPREIILGLQNSLETFINASSDKVFELWRQQLAVDNALVHLNDENGTWRLKDLDENGRLLVVNINDGTQRIIDDGDSLRYLDRA